MVVRVCLCVPPVCIAIIGEFYLLRTLYFGGRTCLCMHVVRIRLANVSNRPVTLLPPEQVCGGCAIFLYHKIKYAYTSAPRVQQRSQRANTQSQTNIVEFGHHISHAFYVLPHSRQTIRNQTQKRTTSAHKM